MLTVSDIRFLQELQDAVDGIECDFVTMNGWCSEFLRPCGYVPKDGATANYAACAAYKKSTGGK